MVKEAEKKPPTFSRKSDNLRQLRLKWSLSTTCLIRTKTLVLTGYTIYTNRTLMPLHLVQEQTKHDMLL